MPEYLTAAIRQL